ncbi:MAG: ABC transporter permease [Planctomycetota bacterium]
MFERILRILTKEFIQVFRDPRMRSVVFLMPVVQLIVFGYAVTTDVRHVATAVSDLDNSVASRELVARFVNSGYFDVVAVESRPSRLLELLDRGDVQAVLRVNSGFAADLRANRSAEVQLLLDGSDSNTAGVVLSYASKIASEFSRTVLVTRLSRVQGIFQPPGAVRFQTRAWFNENLESRNYYVPGVVAILLTLLTLILTSMAVVREKEIGTIEQIMVTPISRVEFIIGKTLPFALIGFWDVLLITSVAALWFHVPIRGSLLLLLFSSAVYLMTTLGVGLLISTVSRTQQQAMMTTFLFFFPANLLSGFMFPIANMPRPVQWLTLANPLRYFLVIIRGIFLKGVGISVLWPQILILALMGVLTLTLASLRFRKTVA